MLRLTCATLLISVATLGAGDAARAVDLKVGDSAPAFALAGSDGRTYRLADFAGKQVLVLAWFAKAFTSG